MTDRSHDSLVLRDQSLASDARQILSFLEGQGTFRFPTLGTGLFSAAAGEGGDFELTGYRSVWVRDNVHIANAHLRSGETARGETAIRSLLTFFARHYHRFADAIEGRSDVSDPMQRPHIRFDGERLSEVDEKWSHAQNDALGAFLWLASSHFRQNPKSPLTSDEWRVLLAIPHFFQTVQYWQDEDSGHWEEVRKVAASSIGAAVAGLREFRQLLIERPPAGSSTLELPKLTIDQVDELLAKGERALASILPAECIQSDPAQARRYDSALLFLIYPFQVVGPQMADMIVEDVTTHLMGDYGIRRYLGDSYWCADYKQKLAADQRTVDFSDNLADRDRLLEPGKEAQWCLFDPIISIHFGLRYERTCAAEDRRRQMFHLQRSLNQVTRPGTKAVPYRCPESYFCEQGRYVPNDICPLLWTQANLKLALRLAAGETI
ncbi:MAG: glycoside hydrolase family 15 protein [Planctomycetaceae bacterium]